MEFQAGSSGWDWPAHVPEAGLVGVGLKGMLDPVGELVTGDGCEACNGSHADSVKLGFYFNYYNVIN
jgi:hypothetical protein